MATDSQTPPAKVLPAGDPDRPQGKVVPLALLAVLLGALVAGGIWVYGFIESAQAGEGQDVKFVFRRLTESVELLGKQFDPKLFWLPILAVVLSLGLVYAVWMYVRDGRQVGWAWASFLATARCAVYLLLAAMFLLPAQQVWEKNESTSRVLMLFDLSGSMNLSDDVPTEGRPPVTRLDQVVRFMTLDNGAFLRNVMVDSKDGRDKNPAYIYAFGGRIDEDFKEFKKGGVPWTSEDWYAFAKLDLHPWVLDGLSDEGKKLVKDSDKFSKEQPVNTSELATFWTTWFKETGVWEKLSKSDKELLERKRDNLPKKLETRQAILTSTNYPDALLTAVTKEGNNMLSGLIIVGDGRSTAGSDSTLQEAINRANNAKVPIFTVAVGEIREQINIRVTDLQAPEQAPPDEKFLVRVEVDGEGLPDKEFECLLDIYKPNQVPGKDKPALTLPGKGVFKAGGGLPHGTVEFTIDPAAKEMATLIKPPEKSEGKPGLEQGEWKFQARVPKAKGEAFVGKEHSAEVPAIVQIVDKPLRVLLFAGGPGKDYQFCRRLFLNEVEKKRAEMSICLQVSDPKGDRAQDVPPERLLKQFPHYIDYKKDSADKADDRYYNLAQYDLILAFDPDWTQVPVESLRLLEQWTDDGGGLVVLAGPINTYQLARGSNAEKLKPIIDLLPVIVEDSRTAGIDRAYSKAWQLHFPGASTETDYLKLEDDSTYPLAGWSEFFWGKGGKITDHDAEPAVRGFYTYYPVKEPKAGATVVATFADPQAKVAGLDGKQIEQPFLVTGQARKGKVVFIGCESMWRLRLFKELYAERFWTKLARYAGSGNLTRQSNRGVLIMGRQFMANQPIRFEAQLKQQNGKPLDKTVEVKYRLTAPTGVQLPRSEWPMEAKREGQWAGYFRGQVQVTAPGKYELVLPIPESGEILRREFLVKEANPELDNARPDFAALEQMASEVSRLRVTDQVKSDLRRRLRAQPRPEGVASATHDEVEPHLFFNLQTAQVIPEYLTLESRTIRNKGKIKDLWSDGPTPSPDLSAWLLWGASIAGFVLGAGLLIAAVVMFLSGRAAFGGMCLAGAAVLGAGGVIYWLASQQYDLKQEAVATTTSALLFVVVGLLSIEWLTRKLLRLA